MTKKTLFIHIPKTAGSSIIETLGIKKKHDIPQDGFVYPTHLTFGHLDFIGLVERGMIPKEELKDRIVFASVRNPYDRFVSLFKHCQRTFTNIPKNISLGEFAFFLNHKLPLHRIGLYKVKDLSQLNPQSDWLFTEGNPVHNLEIRYEDLQESFKEFCDYVGFKNAKNLIKSNISQREYWREYYKNDPQAIMFVNRFYHRDFVNFGYKKMRPR